ncbi:MAG: winged helix-turn-helix domain-containing protein [Planctomycetota bacterium]
MKHGNAERPDPTPRGEPERGHRWTFLSNHAHVLICLARDADLRIRDIAAEIGITERAVTSILSDLEAEGLIERHREGRRNSYVLRLEQPLRHPIEDHRSVAELVQLILNEKDDGPETGPPS